MPRLPQNKNGKKREEKEKYYKEHLLKMQRNAEISATCLKGKESSQLFFSFFQYDIWLFWVLRIHQFETWLVKRILKWFLFNQQIDEVATQGCGPNSVEDVELSENISENQNNISKLFFISPFTDCI